MFRNPTSTVSKAYSLCAVCFTAVLTIGGQALAQASPQEEATVDARVAGEELATRLRTVVHDYYQRGFFVGAVLVGEGEQVLYADAVGLANRDWGIPNSVDTRFRLASITKQFTSMVIMQLVQEGVLTVDMPLMEVLSSYAPDERSSGTEGSAWGPQVTIRHLLNHTSGIPSYTDLPGFMALHTRDPYEVDMFVREFCSLAPEFEPGTAYHYNNSGYFLLGAIIEEVTGQRFEEAVRTRIFEPASMHNSGYDHQGRVVKMRASGYGSVLGYYHPAAYIDMSIPYAAGSLYSTVEDMWRWHRALCSNLLLKPELKAQLFEPGLADYGFGWQIHTDDGAVSHGGGIMGFSTFILRWPASQRCIVVLSNDEGARSGELARDLGLVCKGVEVSSPEERPDVTLAKTVVEQGPQAGLDMLEAISTGVAPSILQGSFDGMAQSLWDLQRRDEALKLWEFNTHVQSGSAQVWDRYAQALEQLGHREDAIEALIRAMEIDPNDLERAAHIDALAAG